MQQGVVTCVSEREGEGERGRERERERERVVLQTHDIVYLFFLTHTKLLCVYVVHSCGQPALFWSHHIQ